MIDVSGTSGVVDLASNFSTVARPGLLGVSSVPARITTSGGVIELAGADLLASDATLRARAGGADAGGGTLMVSSDRGYTDTETSTTARGFFQKRGFKVLKPAEVDAQGSGFTNFRMAKPLL